MPTEKTAEFQNFRHVHALGKINTLLSQNNLIFNSKKDCFRTLYFVLYQQKFVKNITNISIASIQSQHKSTHLSKKCAFVISLKLSIYIQVLVIISTVREVQ